MLDVATEITFLSRKSYLHPVLLCTEGNGLSIRASICIYKHKSVFLGAYFRKYTVNTSTYSNAHRICPSSFRKKLLLAFSLVHVEEVTS